MLKKEEVANLRIFVEQAICRLKTLKILKYEMPILLLNKFDDIVTICAALWNLYPKLCTRGVPRCMAVDTGCSCNKCE